MDKKIYSPYELYQKIKNDLNTDIKYAKDRVKQLNECMDMDLYINALSEERFIDSQVKTTDDFLSENMGSLTEHLDRLADYILYAKFDDEDNEREIKELDEKIKEADRKNKQRRAELRDKRREIKPHRRIERTRRGMNQEVYVSTPKELEAVYGTVPAQEDMVVYTFKDKELNQKGRFKNSEKYWEHYCQKGKNINSRFLGKNPLPYKEFAYSTLKSLETEIRRLEETLEVMSEKHPRYKTLKNKDLMTLKSNYNISADILRKPTVLKVTRVLNRSSLDSVGNRIDYNNPEVIKALLFNFQTIQQEGEKNPNSILWTLSQDTKEKIKKVRKKLTPIQNIILDELVTESTFSGVRTVDKLNNTYNIGINRWSLSRHINKIIERIIELENPHF